LPVSKLSTESVGSRRELVANCVHTADADATKHFRRVGVGGVYWALDTLGHTSTPIFSVDGTVRHLPRQYQCSSSLGVFNQSK